MKNSVYNKVNDFNNSKIGIIIGFILCSLMWAIGIFTFINNLHKGLIALGASIITILIALGGTVVEFNRLKKLKSLQH